VRGWEKRKPKDEASDSARWIFNKSDVERSWKWNPDKFFFRLSFLYHNSSSYRSKPSMWQPNTVREARNYSTTTLASTRHETNHLTVTVQPEIERFCT